MLVGELEGDLSSPSNWTPLVINGQPLILNIIKFSIFC